MITSTLPMPYMKSNMFIFFIILKERTLQTSLDYECYGICDPTRNYVQVPIKKIMKVHSDLPLHFHYKKQIKKKNGKKLRRGWHLSINPPFLVNATSFKVHIPSS